MEMYFFSEGALERFLHFLVRKDGGLAARFVSTLTPVLQELFLIRATNESLDLRLSWLEVEKQCSVKKGAVQFDPDAFVHKYLNKGSKIGEKDRFQAERANLRMRATSDPKHHINGHDFIRLLAKLLHGVTRNKNLADPEVVERTLAGCGLPGPDEKPHAARTCFSAYHHKLSAACRPGGKRAGKGVRKGVGSEKVSGPDTFLFPLYVPSG